MLFRSGRGDFTTYRAVTADDTPRVNGGVDERTANFAWVAIHRYGPITRTELAEHVPAGDDALDAALARLVRDRRATSEERDGRVLYSSADVVIPQDEYSPTFPFFDQDEVTIDSGGSACASGVCLVANFRGRTSCPYGQPATETDQSTVDPTLGPEERCYLPGASHDPVNEITVPVDPQLVGLPPKESVYCSCRCDGPAGSGPFCTCPDGFACTHLVDERGAGSDTRFAGSYCVKSDIPKTRQTTQVVCDRGQRAPRPIGCDDP